MPCTSPRSMASAISAGEDLEPGGAFAPLVTIRTGDPGKANASVSKVGSVV